jgi:hypothetical protein
MWKGLCKTAIAIMRPSATHAQSIDYGGGNRRIYVFHLHRKAALTSHSYPINFGTVDDRKGCSNKISQPEVDWVIGSVGQPVEQPDLKKPTTLRGVVGVWNCESSDYIRGRDGACFHAVGFLARSR